MGRKDYHMTEMDAPRVFAAAPRGAGEAALAYGQGPAGTDPAGEQGAHGEARGLLDGGPEPVPGGGRAPEGDAVPVSGPGTEVQQGQAPDQGVSAEVRRRSRALKGWRETPRADALICLLFSQGDRVPEEGDPAVRAGGSRGLAAEGGVRTAPGAGTGGSETAASIIHVY